MERKENYQMQSPKIFECESLKTRKREKISLTRDSRTEIGPKLLGSTNSLLFIVYSFESSPRIQVDYDGQPSHKRTLT